MKKAKIKPCPKCKSKDIEIFNCGYSSFNPGGGKCGDCGFKVTQYVNWNDSDAKMVKIWNSGLLTGEDKLKLERKKTRVLRKQIRDHGFKPLA